MKLDELNARFARSVSLAGNNQKKVIKTESEIILLQLLIVNWVRNDAPKTQNFFKKGIPHVQTVLTELWIEGVFPLITKCELNQKK